MDNKTSLWEELNQVPWPMLPDVADGDPQADMKKVLFQAKVQAVLAVLQADIDRGKAQAAIEAASRAAQTTADTERQKAAFADHYAHRQAIYGAYIDVAKSAVERARVRAEFIERAAATVGVAYAALLGLSYRADQHHLPARGVVPTIFFCISLVLVIVYLAFITKQRDFPGARGRPALRESQHEDLIAYIKWSRQLVLSRRSFLHASIVSFAFGVAFLPLAFIELPGGLVITFTLLALLAVSGVLGVSWLWDALHNLNLLQNKPHAKPAPQFGEGDRATK